MATTAGMKFDPLGIATIITREVLHVPLNQREYSWTSDNVEDLFKDLADAEAGNKPTYFLGTVVLNTATDQLPEIVDGQQRLATTLILLASFRDYKLENGDEEFAKSIEDEFLFRWDRPTRDIVPKLTLNVDDNQYFKSRILQRPDHVDRKSLKDPLLTSHRLIDGAGTKAAERVRTIVRGHGDPDARINAWIDYLKSRAIVISLTVPSEMDAFKMFETLNDRGLPTTQADLLKNYLFRQAGISGIAEAQQKWSSMRASLESLGIENVVLAYLRHVTLALLGPASEKTGLYDRLEKSYAGKPKTLLFIDSLSRYADDYAAILTPTHSKWNTYDTSVTDSIATMRELGVAQIRPLMLAVATHFSKADAEKAFRAFICWTVRFLIVGGMRGQGLEDAYAKKAHAIATGTIKTFQSLKSSMKADEVVPGDAKFEAQFAITSVSKAQLARYYLRALEAASKSEDDSPELVPIRDTTILNLEHIMPQSGGTAWGHVSQDVADANIKRIGNLVLLNARKNALIGNMSFSQKRDVFKNSAILLTRHVFENSRPDTQWGPADIRKRQEKLAKLAVKTWPF